MAGLLYMAAPVYSRIQEMNIRCVAMVAIFLVMVIVCVAMVAGIA